MASKQLAVFTIGPVQSFIAASKKIEDLWSGSYLLSHLVRHSLKSLYGSATDFDLIFPYIKNKEVLEQKTEVASFPNRFTALIDGNSEQVTSLLRSLEKSVREELRRMVSFSVQRTFGEDEELHRQAVNQTNDFLEIYWAFEPVEEEFDAARKNAEQKIGALKNMKTFEQEEGDGFSCSLCKERTTLVRGLTGEEDYSELKEKTKETWQSRSYETSQQEGQKIGLIRNEEHFCGICLAKRLSKKYYEENVFAGQGKFAKYESIQEIGEKEDAYYGILIMDGDNMGKLFQGKNEDDFKEISRSLDEFAGNSVPAIVTAHNGTLVYAGGDDVFAFLPVTTALRASDELRLAFKTAVNSTASAGLAIVHKTAPLQIQIQKTRGLEGEAKAYRNPKDISSEKNAVAIGRFARSGEITTCTVPWQNLEGEKLIPVLESFIGLLENRDNSTKFIYNMIAAFSPLIGADRGFRVENNDMMMTEFKRLLKRSAIHEEAGKDLELKVANMSLLHGATRSTFDFLQLLKILTAFKQKKGGGKRGEQLETSAG